MKSRPRQQPGFEKLLQVCSRVRRIRKFQFVNFLFLTTLNPFPLTKMGQARLTFC